jgi:hypothetical protein
MGGAHRTRSNVSSKPFTKAISFLLECKHGFEFIFEGKVQGLSGKVADNICTVTAP